MHERSIPSSENELDSALPLTSPEPWPDPVNGADLLDELEGAFVRHLTLPRGAEIALPLWTLFTHAHDAFQHSPLLTVTSPTEGCGKTTLLTLLKALVWEPDPTSNIKPAALYRQIESSHPTLLIDEADTFMNTPAFRGVVDSSWYRPFAFVTRTENGQAKRFSTWSPIVIARIGSFESTVQSRSILIQLQKQTREESERIESLSLDRLEALDSLRRKAQRWALDQFDSLVNGQPHLPEGFHNRQANNWRPLFVIADLAGGDWSQKMLNAARILSTSSDQLPETKVLLAMQKVFEEQSIDKIFSRDLQFHEDWPEWFNGSRFNLWQLASILRKFGIRPRTIRIGSETAKGYHLEDLEDTFNRYCPKSVTASQSPPANALGGGNGRAPTSAMTSDA
jgi:hypothetical protein